SFQLLHETGKDWRIYHDGMAQVMAFPWVWEEHGKHWSDFADFEGDVSKGLPHYTFIEPNHMGIHSNSQHPGNNIDPTGGNYDFERGEALIARVYEALRKHPEVFARTLLLFTYDEHGGLFDRRRPPTGVCPPAPGKPPR